MEGVCGVQTTENIYLAIRAEALRPLHAPGARGAGGAGRGGLDCARGRAGHGDAGLGAVPLALGALRREARAAGERVLPVGALGPRDGEQGHRRQQQADSQAPHQIVRCKTVSARLR